MKTITKNLKYKKKKISSSKTKKIKKIHFNNKTRRRKSNKSINIKRRKTRYAKYLRGGNNDEPDICAICLEDLSNRETITLSCNPDKKTGHKFHKDCTEVLVNKGNLKCPMCRKEPIELLEMKIYQLINELIDYDNDFKKIDNKEDKKSIRDLVFNKILENKIYFNEDIKNIVYFYLYIVNKLQKNLYYGINDITYQNNLIKSISRNLVHIIEEEDDTIEMVDIFKIYFNDELFFETKLNKINENINQNINKIFTFVSDDEIIKFIKNPDYNNRDIIDKFNNIINIIYIIVFYFSDISKSKRQEQEEQYNKITQEVIPQLLYNHNKEKTQEQYKEIIENVIIIIQNLEN